MISTIKSYIKKNKLGLISYFIVLFLLISALVIRYYYLGIYPISLFLIYLLFVLTQYFGFEYKYLIGSGLLFLIICFFLIIFRPKFELDYLYIHSKQTGLTAMGLFLFHRMADYFANYSFGFLIFGTISLFIYNLRNKYLKIFKIIFLSIIILMLSVTPLLIYFQPDCKIALKDIGTLIESKIKNNYFKIFNKKIYYAKKNKAFINGEIKEENIKIFIDFPKDGENITGVAKISGAAFDLNSNLYPGIDRVEVFLGGNPSEKNFIKKFTYITNYETNNLNINDKTIAYINNIYIQFFNRRPSTYEFNYWITNLEYGIYSYYDVVKSIYDSYEFKRRLLSNKDFLEIAYKGLFNRESDAAGLNYWLDQMKGGLDQNSVINILINSSEFKIPVEEYYKVVKIKKDPISFYRKEIGDKYGKQFYLSGFDISFNSSKFKNGKYDLYIYAHSPIYGWDFKKVNINIKN
ncbi:MAG: DUF4214 domain-containing protein [Cyanobacteria bacterium]|nr:DUF4214 domain-containing protein [Cyanobacteriota bacterium]